LKNKPVYTDLTILISLTLITFLFAYIFVDFSETPLEDAAVLMRYADNFAKGFGIVWNIGGKPVDGATDFLFMIFVGSLVKVGISLELATRFIGFSSHILTVFVIYFSLRKIFHAPLTAAFASAVYLTVGPGLYYVAVYFGTPFFALFASLAWYAALLIIKDGEKKKSSVFFAAFALITSLIRPEGVILTFLMLLSIIYMNGFKKSHNTVIYYTVFFLLLGGLYFIWRWNYFQYPLPNPFYKKGGGLLHFDGLAASAGNTLSLCLPLVPVYILGFYSSKIVRLTISLLIPIIGFTLIFILISNEMNFKARFQYIVLPIALMSWWPLVSHVKEDILLPAWKQLTHHNQLLLALLLAVFYIAAIYNQYENEEEKFYNDGRYDIALMLNGYKDKDLKLATTESGLLPLYSHWKSLDTWGLNDQWIAHNNGITEEYLAAFRPDVIVSHCPFSPVAHASGEGEEWYQMCITIKNYAEKNGYVLAADFGVSPYDTHYYYVRPDFPGSREIIKRIRGMDYYWRHSGVKAVDYARFATTGNE
jgi:arabinofuranosyltransferase